MRQHQLALEALQIDVGERLGDQHAIEIRGEHLGERPLGGVFADEFAGTRLYVLDDALVMALGNGDVDEIPDDGT